MAKEIYFRSSSFGNLMTDGKGTTLTEKQAETLAGYEKRIAEGGRALTDNQQKEFDEFTRRKNAPPELSESAKKEVEKVWLIQEKGYYEELDNKFVAKGLLNEQDGLDIVSKHTGYFLTKNDERVYKNNITGEADGFLTLDGKKICVDIKSSWSPMSFKNAGLSGLYEYQLRCYMYLYDVEEAWLCYCLTDTPEHLVENERWKIRNKYGVIGDDEPILPILDQIQRNHVFSTNPAYSKDEMVKIYKITRCPEIEKEMLSKIPLALSYYAAYKLNKI